MPLGIEGFTYTDLYRRDRLEALLIAFEADLQVATPALADALRGASSDARRGARPAEALGGADRARPHVASFVARLFGVETRVRASDRTADRGRAGRARPAAAAEDRYPKWTAEAFAEVRSSRRTRDARTRSMQARSGANAIVQARGGADTASDPELAFARALLAIAEPKDDAEREDLDTLCRRAAWMHHFAPERRTWTLLGAPEPLDYGALVRREHPDPDLPELSVGPEETLRRRDGFRLTDRRMKPRGVMAEVEYCILCHAREKDSCSRGLREKTGEPKENPLGIPLAGCPLQEKISEAHALRRRGRVDRRPRADHDRQPDVPGHRPPDLQRLHEGLHLPEAGAGEHPAGRDRHPDRRALAALRGRDLHAAHALEPVEPAAADARAVPREEGARGGTRSGRLYTRTLPAQRGVRRRRDRRAQDRAAAGGADRFPRACASPDPGLLRALCGTG